MELQQVWDIFCRHLAYTAYIYDARIHSFVLMNNHFHLLISTPNASIGGSRLTFPMVPDETLFSDVDGTLSWLNTGYSETDYAQVRQALRNKNFKLMRDRNTRAPSTLETRLS